MRARDFLVAGIAAAALMAGVAPVLGESYPTRPIRLLVPLAPGGGNDTVARLVGQKLADVLGQPVVVDNRPGGGSVIASEIAAKAPPDGHTLYLVSTAFTVAPSLQKKLPFDPAKDFAALTRVAVAPGALIAHPSLPIASVADLVALAKSRPDEVTFGSAGIGSGSHLGGELFKHLAGVALVHVPYRGSALVTTALLGGEVKIAFTNPTSSLPHVKAGRLKMFAVTTSERWPLLPDVPTIAESGVRGYELLIWNGMVARAGTPPAVLARVHRELVKIVQSRPIVDALAVNGSRVHPESRAAFTAFLAEEIAKWNRIIRQAGIGAN